MKWRSFVFACSILSVALNCGSLQSRTETPLSGQAPSKDASPASKAGNEQLSDIRRVDFRNFTYQADSSCLDDSKPIRVINGEHKEYRDGTRNLSFFLRVDDVVFGDLTGDGQAEAVVRVACDAGSYVNEALIYTLQSGAPKLLTVIDSGHRALGGIISVKISDGLLEVERYESDTDAATPKYIYTETLRYDGSKLIEAAKPQRRKYDKSEN